MLRCTIFFTALLLHSAATAELVTVDDTAGDPLTGSLIIFPQNWNDGPQCSVCTITTTKVLDVKQIHDQTWHDSTVGNQFGPASQWAQFVFTGSAISVYGILPPIATEQNGGNWPTSTHLVFSIDGQNVANFTQDLANDAAYNVLFLEKSDLIHSQHTLVIEHAINPQRGSTSVALLDYLTYWHDTETTTTGNGLPALGAGVASARPGVTSSTSGVTNAASGVPSTISGVPSTISGFTSITLGATSAIVPGVTSAVPGVTSAMPGATSTITGFTNSTPSPALKSSHIGAIVGSVLGALGALLLAAAIIVFFVVRRRRQNPEPLENQAPDIRVFPLNTRSRGVSTKNGGAHTHIPSPQLAPPDYDTITS